MTKKDESLGAAGTGSPTHGPHELTAEHMIKTHGLQHPRTVPPPDAEQERPRKAERERPRKAAKERS